MNHECEHDTMEALGGGRWVCPACGYEDELTAADFGGPDTVAEAEGAK